MFPKEEVELGDVVMEVKGLCKKGQFENLNFKLRKGEILGFSGLVGAGRTEMANVLFGKERPDSGEIILNGKSIAIKSPSDALDLHMGYVPEDRKQYGLNLAGSIKDNIAVTQWDSISKMGFVNKKEENELGAAMVEKLGIKIGSPNHPASSLSGGNQQKIVLAKWVSHDLDILILDEPTRGVDVGAKAVSYTHLDVYKRQIYRNAVAIRAFEMAAHEQYANGLLHGSVHLYAGEEGVAAGVCGVLNNNDYITSTHRGHGHLIAKGGDLKLMMAELSGKATGYCKGLSLIHI